MIQIGSSMTVSTGKPQEQGKYILVRAFKLEPGLKNRIKALIYKLGVSLCLWMTKSQA